MKHIKTYILTFSIILLALVFANPTHADAAPPAVPEGENILPGEKFTMVQMVAEEVIIDVGSTLKTMYSWVDEGYGYYPEGFLVAYNCTFWMVNQGEETETLAVRFPINTDYALGKIEIESIKINDSPISWTEDDIDSTTNHSRFNWAHFDVTFPPGEEVEIKITYTTITHAWYSRANQSVSYILETGAGWYGPIGKGRIILRLPYNATSENVIMAYSKYPIGEITDYGMVWEFTDLEPTQDDNWEILITSPDVWSEILADREKLEKSPNNLSALFRLAENINVTTSYKYVQIFSQTLYDEGLQAIQKAVSLNPDEIAYHEVYMWYLLTDYRSARTNSARSIENTLALLEEIDILIDLDSPYQWIQSEKPDIIKNLEIMQTATAWAAATETATPTPPPSTTPTPAPSSTHTATASATQPPTPTETPAPEITPTPTITEIEGAPRSPLPTTFLVIAAIILAAGLAVWLIKSRK